MISVEITKRAEDDLISIAEYIGLDNPQRATSFIEELLESSVNLISTFPCSAPLYDKKKDIRRYVYQEYNVYYRYLESEKKAQILHILNSALEQSRALSDI